MKGIEGLRLDQYERCSRAANPLSPLLLTQLTQHLAQAVKILLYTQNANFLLI